MKDSLNKFMLRYLLVAALLAITIGTIFYHLVEKLSWLNSYYFTVITLTTIGYGDITPHTNAGKIFTTFFAFFGIGIITTFISTRMQYRGQKFHERRIAKKDIEPESD